LTKEKSLQHPPLSFKNRRGLKGVQPLTRRRRGVKIRRKTRRWKKGGSDDEDRANAACPSENRGDSPTERAGQGGKDRRNFARKAYVGGNAGLAQADAEGRQKEGKQPALQGTDLRLTGREKKQQNLCKGRHVLMRAGRTIISVKRKSPKLGRKEPPEEPSR